MARTFGNLTLAQAVGDVVEQGARGMAVSLPGIVVTYSAATQTATIKPGVNRLVPSVGDEDEDVSEELPAIPDVPVAWYRARGVSIVPPVGLLPGDPVTLLCMDRDISAWSRSGAVSDPDDYRSHHWANAIAIPGLVPSTNPFTTPVDSAALASRVLAELSALIISFNLLVTAYNGHSHAALTPAGAPTAMPVLPFIGVAALPAAPVGSNILKVDS